MAEDFADKTSRLVSKAEFVEASKQSLNALFGEPATLVIINHLGGAEALQDPKAFYNGLKALFGVGAEIIMKIILKKLETPSET